MMHDYDERRNIEVAQLRRTQEEQKRKVIEDFPDPSFAGALMRKLEEMGLNFCTDPYSSSIEDRLYYKEMYDRLLHFGRVLQQNLAERVTYLEIDEEEFRRHLSLSGKGLWKKKSDDIH